MDDLAELAIVLAAIGIVLSFVAVIGHGIWLLAALIFRAIFSPRQVQRFCPRCGAALQANRQSCDACRWPEAPVHKSSQGALRAVREQVEQLARQGLVDAAARDKILDAVVTEERRVAAEAKPAAALAAAAPARPAQTAAHVAPPVAASAPPADVSPPVSDEASLSSKVPLAEVVPPVGHVSLGERARKYAASREAATAETLAEPVAPVAPPPKRREAVSRLLAAFMEEKNIRWGELVGGLLIIGCSIALVISFWSQIAERPLLKFGLFNGVTAALFGVGLYTDRRWKIHTTSHGVLLIATLLVPLNFLAIAAFTEQSPPTDVLSLAGEAFSIVVFSALVFMAGRSLVPDSAPLLVAGVMIPSLTQLLVRRFAGVGTPLVWLYALAAVPIGVYVVSTSLVARRQIAGGTGELDETQSQRILAFLGVVSFAVFLPLGLLAFKVPPIYGTLHRLSPLLVACGLPAMLVGLLFWRSLGDKKGGWGRASSEPPDCANSGGSLALDPSHPRSDQLTVGLQTTGIGVGVLGALVMIGAIVLAWPEPATLLPTTLVAAVVLAIVAVWFGIPAAYVPAGLALAGAWLIGFHLLRGNVAWLTPDYEPVVRAFISAASGHALVPMVGAFGLGAWALSRKRLRNDALMIGLVAGIVAAVSLGLVLWFGFGRYGDPENITWTLAIYGVGVLAAAIVLDWPAVAWVAMVLLFLTLDQAILLRYGEALQLERPWITTLLAFATLTVALLGGLQWRWHEGHANLRLALAWSALAASLGSAVLLIGNATSMTAVGMAEHLAWLAGVWLVLSALANWRPLLVASQVGLVAAIVCAVKAAVETRSWYVEAPHPWFDPWFLEAQGIALAGYCLLMFGVRRRWRMAAKPQAADGVGGWTVDRLVTMGLVAVVAWVAYYAVMPGVTQELAPLEAPRGAGAAVRVVQPIEQYRVAGIAQAHAADRGGWALLAAVAVVMAVGWWRHANETHLVGLLVAAVAVCPLIAARWEADVAVASALRWLSAGFLAAVSIPIWLRRRWSAPGIGSVGFDGRSSSTAITVRNFLVAAIVLMYVAMGLHVFSAALWRAGVPQNLSVMWPYVLGWALVAGVVALVSPRVMGAGAKPQAAGGHVRDVLLLLAVAPAAILVTFAAAKALDQHPIVGPNETSWFRTIGWDVSYGVPLAVMGLTFVGYAVRDRSSRFAFAAGLLFNVVATIVLLMRLARGGGSLDAAAWLAVAQVNAIVAGAVALAWLGVVWGQWRVASGEWRDEELEALVPRSSFLVPQWPALLVTQAALAAALCGAYLLPGVGNLVFQPGVSTWAAAADGVLGWLAVVLATIAGVWINGRRGVSQNGVALFVAALVALVALRTRHWTNDPWLAFRTLMVGLAAAAWLLPLATRAVNRGMSADAMAGEPLAWSAIAARLFAVAAVLLALGSAYPRLLAPNGVMWAIAILLVLAARNVWIAWFERGRGSLWLAAVLFQIAAVMWWFEVGENWIGVSGPATIELQQFLWVNAAALAAMGLVSVWVEYMRIATPAMSAKPPAAWSLHRFAAWAAIVVLLLAVGGGLIVDLVGGGSPTNLPVAWGACLAVAILAVACCWDRAVRWPIAALYCVGLIAVGQFLDGLNARPPLFQWALALGLAAYSLATSGLWSVRDRIRATAVRWGMPVDVENSVKPRAAGWFESEGHGWLVPMNFLLGVFVLVAVCWIELTMESFRERMVAAYAVGAQVFALGLLARGAVRTPLQYLALVWGVLFAVAFGWAWLPVSSGPGTARLAEEWLHRLVAAAAALAVAVVVYGFGLVKFLRRENEWTKAAARLVPSLAGLAVGLILAVLAIEVVAYVDDGDVPIRMPAFITVCIALAGLAVAALVAALVPGRDPLGLSERGRTIYVYVAEALAGLLFLHIRVTQPWLFSGWFLRFWPLVVMLIAFVGVGVGELFQRRRQKVLSEPLQNTGALLPLLPVLGFWVMRSEVHYSLLLLSIGALYGVLSVLRKSFGFGVLAALAANGGLWYLLFKGDGLGLFEHPQLWLIPPALSMLAAGYINRERLSSEQTTALRYFSAIVIYVSSTADIFLNGVAEAPWLPAVLAGLSIAGVLAGIMLRVRAFLYLGTAFLVVALMTVIWHAAEQNTWVWFVAGIVVGSALLILFGLFEKRRDDVLRVVEQLKHWEA